ncbi:hypothetical protein, partial [Klebsiella pneumoniae]|uniref:hypothetical protein n=1 Tax=Klebsiella pneumoniae TaxID=573 RepID=UPI001C8E0886
MNISHPLEVMLTENSDTNFLLPTMISSKIHSRHQDNTAWEGANKRGNSSRLTQSFHFFMFEPIFSPVNALN